MFRSNRSEKELDRLEKKYGEKLRDNPASSSFVLLAEVLLERNKVEKAVSVLIKGLRNNSNMITARYLLGKAYFMSWNIDLALKELGKVIKLAPDHFSASELLIEIKKSEKKYGEALEIVHNLSSYYRGNSELRRIREELESCMDEAKENSDESADEKPKVKIHKHNDKSFPRNDTIADIYISQGQYQKAIEILTELLFREPRNQSYREKYNRITNLLSRKSLG